MTLAYLLLAPAVVVHPTAVQLHGKGASQSLLVTASRPDGQLLDRTRAAQYTSHNPAVASVTPHGVIRAVADGSTTVTVRADGQSLTVAVQVRDSDRPRQYH